MKESTPATWAQEEFGHASIEDHRWRRRLVSMATRLARRPAGRVTEAFVDDAERQGAYGLLESDAVTGTDVGTALFAACARRCAGEKYVFCPVDGTSLTLADHARGKGFGPIGVRSKRGRGLKVMNAMALTSQGVPLGVISQQWWTRSDRRRHKHRDRLPPEQKETNYWLESMKQIRQVTAEHAAGTRCWFQLDREGDAWPLLREAGLEDHWFTIRACRKRRVLLGDGSRSTLHQVLEKQQVLTDYELEVRASGNRQARKARMVVRACKITLDCRDKRTRRRFPIEVNVVQALEDGTTPKHEKPIAWTLLTNHPIASKNDLTTIVLGYSMRWRIEELHRTWKTGACRVEETQLRSPSAVIKWASILVAVAARIERIKQLSREEPDRPATDEFSPVEIKAAALLRFGKSAKKRAPDATVPTIAEVTLWIAQLGGYTGRTSSGGPPGSITLARGLEQVRTAVQALEALAQ